MSEKPMTKAAPEPQQATAAASMAVDAQACAERAVRQHEQAMHQQATQRAPMAAPMMASAAAAGEAAYHHHHHHAKAERQGVAGQGVAGQGVAGQGVAGQGVAGQSVAGQGVVGQGLVEKEARSILPSVSSVVQAGAFGAALGGMTTGVMEMARVKQGEISTDEAIRNVVKSSTQGAATMAVASVAAQVVRSHPVFGFIALAAAGIGAFVILSGASAKAGQPPASPPSNLPRQPEAQKPH